MNNKQIPSAFILGALICAGLALLGYFISGGIVHIKSLERTVTVKGLSEREIPADIAIWPINFNEAENDLNQLFSNIESKNALVVNFLKEKGFEDGEFSISAPSITDRFAQGYVDTGKIPFRYAGTSTITVYTKKVDGVINALKSLIVLGKFGIVISTDEYNAPKTEFLFTNLNSIKPAMIEEATQNAREVAEKFATDSKSKLGKIKTASQGQFSIDNRDSNTPHIKKIRVVSTVEYYLSD
jgi:uncharacterized protein